MNSRRSDRRRFLKDGAVLAGLAVGAIRSASGQILGTETSEGRSKDSYPFAYGERSHFVDSVRIGTNGRFGKDQRPGVPRDYGFRTPLQNSVGIITPASLHFMIAHGYDPPDIDPREHRLMIHGRVDRPLIFTLEELERLPSVSRIHFVECAGNSAPSGAGFAPGMARIAPAATAQQTHGLTSCSEWTGVPLSRLLQEAGVQKGASWIVAEGAEQGMHSKSIPLEKAMDDCLVAYGQNGEPVRPEQGYPLRLLVPGWEGINNVKWLRRIKVVDQPYMGMREATKYPSLRVDGKARWFQFELGPKSVITRPSGGQKLSGRGFYEITGLAWSGGGAIRRVEVSTDGGRTWKDAELQGPVHRKAHARFRLGWTWNGEETVLQSRCTDERDERQPTVAELGKILRINLSEDFFTDRPDTIGHFNAIQSWRVNRDGSVQNAIFS
jgi:sulfane dehydrogenase subunit SoxC